MDLAAFNRLFVGQGETVVSHGQKGGGMGPVLKNIAMEEHLVGHGGFELWDSRMQYMMVGSLHHRDAVDLYIAKVVDGFACARYAAAEGL